MTKPRRSPNRAIIAATAAGALLIGGAVVALAAQPDAPVITGPTGFISNASPVFGIADADGAVNVNGAGTFLYDFDGGGAPSTPLAAPGGNVSPASPLGQGSHNIQALEVGGADPDSTVATSTFFVDTVPPLFTRVVTPLTGSLSGSGWYTGNVGINMTCEAQTSTASGVAACLPDQTLDTPGEDGVFPLGGETVTDRAGNLSAALPPLTIKRDSTDPDKPTLVEPLSITNTLTPSFVWSLSEDPPAPGAVQSSGMAHYVVTIRKGASGGSQVQPPQQVAQPVSGTQVTYGGVPALENGSTYNWVIQAVDVAGNTINSTTGVFTVDTTAPDDPAFTAGPTNGAATNDNTPTFTFTGVPGATFTWETRNSLDELVTSAPGFGGTGATGTVTLPTLPDGNYTFKVKQTAPNLKVSGFGSALFTVDTTAPAAPNITSSPGTTTNSQPSFGWSAAEQDGSFVWEVTGVGGIRVQGPGEAAAAAVSLPTSLVAGNYAFRVRQRDRAGNLSDWSAGEPFTIVNPQDPGPGPGTGGGTSGFRPSTRNAKALLPKVGVKVKPTATTLRWKKTKGATLYNLQVFRIDGTTYRKVHSAFPRGLTYKVPKKVLKSGKRYVWRVWPYLGAKKKYTPAPFGISWFDAK